MAADSTMFLTMNLFTALSFGTNAPLDSQNTLLTCGELNEKISIESVSFARNGYQTSHRPSRGCARFPQNPFFSLFSGFERPTGKRAKIARE